MDCTFTFWCARCGCWIRVSHVHTQHLLILHNQISLLSESGTMTFNMNSFFFNWTRKFKMVLIGWTNEFIIKFSELWTRDMVEQQWPELGGSRTQSWSQDKERRHQGRGTSDTSLSWAGESGLGKLWMQWSQDNAAWSVVWCVGEKQGWRNNHQINMTSFQTRIINTIQKKEEKDFFLK